MRILIVEDDRDLNRQLVEATTEAGYVVDHAFDGEEGHFLGDTEPYDAVILDIGLPQMDGLTVLEKWRRDGRIMPVLLLTARDRWSDKVAGIDAGADDYVAKPFHIEEVLARLRALIRRAAGHASSEITCGPLRLDTKTSKAAVNGTTLKLTSHEFRLLSYLMHHMDEVVSRTELVEHLYDQDFDRDSNTIEVFVGRLRKKMGIDLIETIRGMGYRLTGQEQGTRVIIRLTRYLPNVRSLSLRVILFSTLWTIVSFVAIATIISALYGEARQHSFQQLLSAHLFSVIASVSVNDGTLVGRPDPGEVRYSSPFSGWYWSVDPVADNLKGSLRSISLGGKSIDSPSTLMVPFDTSFQRSYTEPGLKGEQLSIVETEVVLDAENRVARFRVMGNLSELEGEIADFRNTLYFYLGVFGIAGTLINAAVI
eukprot:gene12374-15119_t